VFAPQMFASAGASYYETCLKPDEMGDTGVSVGNSNCEFDWSLAPLALYFFLIIGLVSTIQ
jgi:hypothetical protein